MVLGKLSPRVRLPSKAFVCLVPTKHWRRNSWQEQKQVLIVGVEASKSPRRHSRCLTTACHESVQVAYFLILIWSTNNWYWIKSLWHQWSKLNLTFLWWHGHHLMIFKTALMALVLFWWVEKKHRQEIKTFRRLSKAAKVVKMDWHESPSCCSLTKKTSLCCQRFGFCCLFWDWELVSVVTYKCDKATFKLVVSIRRVTLFLHSVARYGNSTFTTLLLPCYTRAWMKHRQLGWPQYSKTGCFKSPLP